MVIEQFLNWVQNASLSKRVDAAGALARAYLRDDIDEAEREDIEAAITTLLEDPAPGVRTELADVFCNQENAPRHVIIALVADTYEVASKILSCSPVFLDQELIHMIRTFDIDKQIAISCRPWMPQTLLHEICMKGCEEACLGALMNTASRFSEENLHTIAERFGHNTEIRVILMDREDLATTTRLMLINKTGEALNHFVTKKSWLSTKHAETVVSEACDKACIAYAANAPEEDVINIVRSLIDDGRMTVAFLLRTVCMGNITLAAAAFSVLSDIRMERIETIFSTNKKATFKAIYDRAGLPQSAFSVFESALSKWREILTSEETVDHARMPYLVTRDVLKAYVMDSSQVKGELLVLLRQLSAETARECAKYKAIEISDRTAEDSKPAKNFDPQDIAELSEPAQAELIIVSDDIHDISVTEIHNSDTKPEILNARDNHHWADIFGKIDRLAANKQTMKKLIEHHAQKPIADNSPVSINLPEYISHLELDDDNILYTDAVLNIPVKAAA